MQNNEQVNLEFSSTGFDKKMTPIISMLSFTTSVVCHKISTWVLFGISSFLVFIIGLIPIIIKNSIADIYGFGWITTYILVVSSLALAQILVLTFFASIQGILRGLNIFKDTEKEGIEILILSKPINRSQILISRFIFLFIFAIILSIVNMLLVLITCAIVGFEYFENIGALIGGVFGATFLSFIAMALIAISIGLKLSNRAATALPIVILSISTFAQIALGSMSSLISNSNQNIENAIAHNLVGRKIDSGVITKISRINFYTTFSPINDDTVIMQLKDIYFQYFLNNEMYYFSWNSYDNGEFEDPKDEKIMNEIIDIITNQTIAASGLTAINYLNPISAFSSIAIANNNPIDSATASLNYNYSVDKITLQWSLNNGFVMKVSQADPTWAVFLVWLFISSCLGTLIWFDYKRKDFH